MKTPLAWLTKTDNYFLTMYPVLVQEVLNDLSPTNEPLSAKVLSPICHRTNRD